MERATLSQKAWYRAIKVVFVLAFLLTQVIGLAITNAIASDKISFVHCDNGKEFENPYFYANDKEKLALFKKCDITAFLLQKSEVKGILTDTQMKELGVQISQMQDSGVLQSEMQLAVDDFKQKYADRTPSNNTTKSYTVEELTKLYRHDFNDSFTVAGNDSHWVANFIFQYKDKHSLATKSIYYILSFLIVSVLFWLISRTFFYIFAKEKFLKLPLK